MTTKTLKISGMHCSSCAMSIDGELEDTEGVKEVKTNYAKSQTEITFDETVVSLEKIQQLISDLGYTASFQE